MLTGKTKEEFEKWFTKKYIKKKNRNNLTEYIHISRFYIQYFSMQWGVYLEFFDSRKVIDDNQLEMYCHNMMDIEKMTRKQAQKAAIKKADEIYNNQ